MNPHRNLKAHKNEVTHGSHIAKGSGWSASDVSSKKRMNAHEVELVIRVAFGKNPPPTGPLTNTYDDEGATEYFAGQSWDGHDTAALRMHEAAMCFFTPEAFRYYLPAYMLAELCDPENADVLGEYVVYQFGEPSVSREQTFEERLALFTQE